MDDIVKGPQTISLPYLQVDVFGRYTGNTPSVVVSCEQVNVQ